MVLSSFLGTGAPERQEKHSGKGIAIALPTALFLNFSVKSLARKVIQKFWGEVSVLSLTLKTAEN